MHSGKSYKLFEFLIWTRHNLIRLIILGVAATVLYQVFGFKWLAIPWTVVR